MKNSEFGICETPGTRGKSGMCGIAGSGEFVRLGFADAADAAALEKLCFTPGWSVEAFLEAFAGLPAFRAYGIRGADGILVAYVTVYHTEDCLEILNFGVLPSERRKGLGRRLLGGVLRRGFKEGIVTSVLDVRTENAAAIALYEGLGYVRVGRRRHYYHDTGEDALIYTLDANGFHFEE